MYLYVYVFLLMGIISLYTQLHLVQVGRMAANQKALAEVMFMWQDGAYDFVKDNGLSATCIVSRGTENPPSSPLSDNCSSLMTEHTKVGITSPFNSVIYTISGTSYLVTYVIDNASGYARAGFRSSEIYQQMKNTDLTPNVYGSVSATSCPSVPGHRGFFTDGRIDGEVVCYPVTSSTTLIPTGAVGYVSML